MKTATLTLETRTRRLRLAKALLRLAGLIRSVRLATFAVGLVAFEMRTRPGTWQRIPNRLRIEVNP